MPRKKGSRKFAAAPGYKRLPRQRLRLQRKLKLLLSNLENILRIEVLTLRCQYLVLKGSNTNERRNELRSKVFNFCKTLYGRRKP
jgi:hypothetical protein